eukprot:Rhum_TRINITY_DN11505_c0_g1::Rhum_TRINITY_DN11505_c0_g1_i1::g.45059::m.45059/K17616/CTDSPL2; CTD small phosphatase-like protein 2
MLGLQSYRLNGVGSGSGLPWGNRLDTYETRRSGTDRWALDGALERPRTSSPPPRPGTPPRRDFVRAHSGHGGSPGSVGSAWTPGNSSLGDSTPGSGGGGGSPQAASGVRPRSTTPVSARLPSFDRPATAGGAATPRVDRSSDDVLSDAYFGTRLGSMLGTRDRPSTARFPASKDERVNSEAWDNWWADVTARRRDSLARQTSTPRHDITYTDATEIRESAEQASAAASAAAVTAAAATDSTTNGGGALPSGWVSARDPATGRTFYHNTATGVSVWEHPTLPTQPRAVVLHAKTPASAGSADDASRQRGADTVFSSYRAAEEKRFGTSAAVSAATPVVTSPRAVRRTPSMEWRGASPFLLPAQDAADGGKYTVVLDLDETLVYARDGPLRIRPGCRELLAMLAEHCELVVWTAGERAYAHSVIEDLDPRKEYVRHCIYRHPKWFTGQLGQVKDLRLLNRKMDRLVIVENTPDCIRSNIHNGIIVSDFLGKEDTALHSLYQILQRLISSEKSVADFLQSCPLVKISSVPTDVGDSIVVYCAGDVSPRVNNQDALYTTASPLYGSTPARERPSYGSRPVSPYTSGFHPHLRAVSRRSLS